jgi:hypothetical protein
MDRIYFCRFYRLQASVQTCQDDQFGHFISLSGDFQRVAESHLYIVETLLQLEVSTLTLMPLRGSTFI